MSDVLLALPMVPFGGRSFFDFSAYQRLVQVFGSPTTVAAPEAPGGMAYFGPVNSQSFLRVDELEIGTIFTIEAIVVPEKIPDQQPPSSSGKYAAVASAPGTAGGSNCGLRYLGDGHGSPGTFDFQRQSSAPGGTLELHGTTYCQPGVAHHVVLQSDGITWSLFVNGNLEDSVTNGTALSLQNQGFQIGGQRNPSYLEYMSTWEGLIFDCVVTKGVAKYPPEGFTPPSRLTPSAMTVSVSDVSGAVRADVIASGAGGVIRSRGRADGFAFLVWPLSDPGPIDLVAYNYRGSPFLLESTVSVGDRLRPSDPNGCIYEVVSAGVLPAQEPDPWPTSGPDFSLGTSVVTILQDRELATSKQVVPGGEESLLLAGTTEPPSNAAIEGAVHIGSESVDRGVVALERVGGLWRVVGAARSDAETGLYEISGYVGDGDVYLMAVDEKGVPYPGEALVSVGDLIGPSSPNGYVYRVVTGGELPATEPDWWTTGQQQVGTATLEAREYLRPLAHGPVDVTFL